MTTNQHLKRVEESAPKIRQVVRIPIGKDAVEGDFVTFENLGEAAEHLAIGLGSWRAAAVPLVRVHSECLTGDVFGSQRCDCGPQLEEAIQRLAKEGGILLYMRQEGRGIGLYNKLDAYALQDRGFDTYESNRMLNFPEDLRSFSAGARMLAALGVKTIRLLTNNPDKREQLARHGIEVKETAPTGVFVNEHNKRYLEVKNEKGGHQLALKCPGQID